MYGYKKGLKGLKAHALHALHALHGWHPVVIRNLIRNQFVNSGIITNCELNAIAKNSKAKTV